MENQIKKIKNKKYLVISLGLLLASMVATIVVLYLPNTWFIEDYGDTWYDASSDIKYGIISVYLVPIFLISLLSTSILSARRFILFKVLHYFLAGWAILGLICWALVVFGSIYL